MLRSTSRNVVVFVAAPRVGALRTRETAHEGVELRRGLLDRFARTGQLEEHVSTRTFGDGAQKGEAGLGRLRSTGHSGGIRPLHRSEEHTSELQSHVNLVC